MLNSLQLSLRFVFFAIGILGSALLFNLHAQSWNSFNKILSNHRDSGKVFGSDVSIDGGQALISASIDPYDQNHANYIPQAGSAYIYSLSSSGIWTEKQKLVASDRDTSYNFGNVVDLKGNRAIIGSVNHTYHTGAAYIFEKNAQGVWHEVAKFTATSNTTNWGFGVEVAIHNDIAVVGYTWWHDSTKFSGNGSWVGAADVFERDNFGVWRFKTKLMASDRQRNDDFGRTVAVEGNIIMVGCGGQDTDGAKTNLVYDAGAVYCFERISGGVWTETQKITHNDRATGDYFGISVDIDGNIMAVGSHKEHVSSSGNYWHAGAVYLFERNPVTKRWVQKQKLLATNPDNSREWFGNDLNLDNDILLVGQPGEDLGALSGLDAGAAYIFEKDIHDVWHFDKKIWPHDSSRTDRYGSRVAVSNNQILIGSNNSFDANRQNFVSGAGSVYHYSTCLRTKSLNNVKACRSYKSPGGFKTWYTPGLYNDTIPNINGCDSILTFNLSLDSSISSSQSNWTICDSVVNPSGTEVWTTNGVYYDTLPNSYGCDSLLEIKLTVKQSSHSILANTSCGIYTSPSGKPFSQSGNYIDTISNIQGCDSVISISLTVYAKESDSLSVTTCNNFKSPSNKFNWTQSGNYTDTLSTIKGCDSVLFYSLSILKNSSSRITPVGCNDYVSPSGKIFTKTGNYYDTISNSIGCDSIIFINVIVNALDTSVTVNPNHISANNKSSNKTYRWLSCSTNKLVPNEFSKTFYPKNSGSFALIIYNQNCEDTSNCHSFLPSSIYEQYQENISVYPNPFDNSISVAFFRTLVNPKVTLYNEIGDQIPVKQTISEKEIQISTEARSGVFHLIIETSDGRVISKKIVKL
ncbi:MAG: T9SS type A sorting domain-containing protein [Salibacteraceae bacterium]